MIIQTNTIFDDNVGGSSVINVLGLLHPLISIIRNISTFIKNVVSSIQCTYQDVMWNYQKLQYLFKLKNDTRENGGTMYMNQGTTVTIDDKITAQFIADTGEISEGAI